MTWETKTKLTSLTSYAKIRVTIADYNVLKAGVQEGE